MSRVALVTGGAGFIGSHIVERLLREGWRTRILDNFSSGTRRNIPNDVEIIEGDIRDLAACQRACANVEAVFHLAALVSVVGSVEDPLSCHEVNIGGTLNLLLAARDSGVKRFVFSSSASVYGDAEVVPTDEMQPLQPQSPYATSKACGEFYAQNFQTLYGLETVVLRYFNVFGARQNVNSGYAAVIPLFVRAALSGRKPTIYGDGLQTRDFVYVANVAEANFLAATQEGAAGRAFNVACGEAISLLDLLAALERITGKNLAPYFEPARSGEVRHSHAVTERACKELGYVPTVTLEEGLRLTLEDAAREVRVATA